MRSVKLLSLALILALGACSDDTTTVTPDKPGTKKDGGGTTPEASTTFPDGATPSTSALQAVINKLTMPKSNTEYAYDYDGTGAKNKLGAITQALAMAGLQGFDFQTSIDSMLAEGTFLMLLELLGKSPTDDPAIVLQAYLGVDNDSPANPANNFTGTGEFKIDPKSPSNLKLPGKVAAGALTAGPGQLVMVIPAGSTPPQVSVQKCLIMGKVADTATGTITDGKIYGVIPWTDVDQKIIPMIATEVDEMYKATATPQSYKDIVKSLFDANKDGSITADEVRNSAILKLILSPDVDTDKNGTADGMSVGLGFTAVKAKIVK